MGEQIVADEREGTAPASQDGPAQRSDLTFSNYLALLQEDPENEEALQGLREIIDKGDTQRLGTDPVRLLEAARNLHEERGEWLAVAGLLEREADLVQGDPDFEASLRKELGRLRHEELLDDKAAKQAYLRVLELRPAEGAVSDAVEQLEQAERNWKEIAARFVEEAEGASDATLKSSLLCRAASLLWQYSKSARRKEVGKLFRQALEADSNNARAVRLYAEVLRRKGDWKVLAALLIESAESLRNRDLRFGMYLRAARVFERQLQNPERAAACYQHVIDVAPSNKEALRFLVGYFTTSEQWDQLVVLYEGALRSRHKLEDEHGTLLQIAMVHWRMRERPDEAEPYFSRLRKAEPAHPGMLGFYRAYLSSDDDQNQLLSILSDAQRVTQDPALKLELATEIARTAESNEATLERAIDAWKTVERLDAGSTQSRPALKELYARSGKWNALVEALKAQIEALPPGTDGNAERVALLREVVAVYRDQLRLDAMVVNTYSAILEIEPGDPEALEALAQSYESLGRWNDLIQILGQRAEAEKAVDAKVALLLRTAQLWIERFANYNQATGPLERILELDGENRTALEELRKIYSKKRAWKPLFDILQREVTLASDPDARLALTKELAQLAADRLHRNEDAIRLWREVLDQDPGCAPALKSLERLAERARDWTTLAYAFELHADHLEDQGQRTRVLQKLAVLSADQLQDRRRAANVWKSILELDPRNGRALRTLREIYVSAQDWDALESFYADNDDWEGLAEVLSGAADKTQDVEVKVRLSLRVAAIYEERLGEAARALRSYERVLGVEPRNARAARALLPLYEQSEKWGRLVQALEVLVDSGDEEDVSLRLERTRRLRQLIAERLGDPERALTWAMRAFALAPDDEDVIQELEATAQAARAHERLRDLYEQALQGIQVPDELPSDEQAEKGKEALVHRRAELRRRLARLAVAKLGDNAAAIQHLQALLQDAPDDGEALQALDLLYRSEGRWEALAELLAQRAQRLDEPEARIALLLDLARLEERELDKPERAAERLRTVLELDARHPEALAMLEAAALRTENWAELARVLQQRCDLVEEPEERLTLMRRLARVRGASLGDAHGAFEAYQRLLEEEPDDAEALQGLEGLEVSAPDLALPVGRVLEGAYERRGRWDQVVAVLRRRLSLCEERADRRRLLLRLAELESAELGDPRAAYASLEAAFRLDLSDTTMWDQLSEAAGPADAREALAEVFGRAVDAGNLQPPDRAELAERTASLFADTLGQPERAEPYYRIVLEHDPLHEPAFAALKERLTGSERWDELESLYRQRIAQTVDGVAKRELLLQLCFLFEELLDRPEEAVGAYQEVLQLDPTLVTARRALERLYRRTESWEQLATLLGEELQDAVGQDALDLSFQLAELYERHLGNAETAVDYYEQVLEQNPTHLRSQEALERLLSNRAQRTRVAELLGPLYEAQGAWSELVRVMRLQLEEVSDVGGRVDGLARVAEILEDKCRDTDGAFDALSQAVRLDASDTVVRRQLERVAGLKGAHVARAAVLEDALGALADGDPMRTELMLEVAQLWDQAASEPEAAQRAYERLIAAAPDNVEVVLPALEALERVHAAQGDYEALARDLGRRAELEPEPDGRMRLLADLAALRETSLGDLAGAINAYEKRLEIDRSDEVALSSLQRLYEARQDWPRLIEILHAREAGGVADDEARQLLVRIAELSEQRLEDSARAIESYERVVERFGEDDVSLNALARLLEREHRWTELLDVLERKRAIADPEGQRELDFRSAELMRRQAKAIGPDALQRAIDAYEELLRQAPEHSGALAALEEVVTAGEGEERLVAARVAVPHFEQAREHQRLLGVLEVLATSDDPVERLTSLRDAARVAEVGLGDTQQSFALLGRAVQCALAEEELGGLLEAYRQSAEAADRWADYVAHLSDSVGDIADEELQVQALLSLAQVTLVELEQPGLARGFYERALTLRPEEHEALSALHGLYSRTEDHQALAAILRRKAEVASQSTERVGLLLELARVCEYDLKQVDDAIAAYENVLAEAPTEDAFVGLERLCRQESRWTQLADVYERRLDAEFGDATETRFRLGDVYLRHLNDPSRGLEELREVLSASPSHDEAVRVLEGLMDNDGLQGEVAELLEPVFLARMEWDKLRAVLEARVAAESDLQTRKDLLRRLGQLHEDYLEDLPATLAAYVRLFREDPKSIEARDLVIRMARVLDEWGSLVEVFRAALDDRPVDDEESAALCFILAQTYDQRMDDAPNATLFYERALAWDPTHTKVAEALEALYQRSGAYEKLATFYRSQLDSAADEGERSQRMHALAAVERDQSHRPAKAVEVYRDLLDADSTDERAADALDALLVELERWEELSDLLRSRIDASLGSEREAPFKERLAELLLGPLADLDGAIDVLEEIVQVYPNYEPALAKLEALAERKDCRMRVTQILEPLYRDADQWKKLVAVYEGQLELIEEPAERVRLLAQVAQLHEQRGADARLAFAAWARALRDDPGDEVAEAEVERLGESLGDWDGVVAAFDVAVACSEDPLVRVRLLAKVASVHDVRRGDPRAAIVAHERLLEADPEQTESLDALEGLRTLVGDWDGLIKVLERKVEVSFDPAVRGDLLRKSASVLNDLMNDAEGAVATYRRALQEDETDVLAWEALDYLLAEQDDPQALADVLERRIELAEEPEQRVELGLRFGDLLEKRLNRMSEAVDAMRRVLDEAPQNVPAAEALTRMYAQQGQWADFVEVLGVQTEHAESVDARVALLVRAAEVHEQQLDDALEAIATYRQVLELKPGQLSAVDGLLRLSKLPDHVLETSEVIEPFLRERERWDDLTQLFERKAEALSDSHDRRAVFRVVAGLHEERRQDAGSAFEAWLKAFAEEPSEPDAVTELERLAGQLGLWERFADALAEQGSSSLAPAEVRGLYERLARICEEKLHDDARAIDAYLRAIEQVGDEPQLLLALDQAYVRSKSWLELGDVLERRLALAEQDAERVELLLRLGQLQREHGSDPRSAFSFFRDVLDHADDPRALQALRELAGDPDLAGEALEALEGAYRRLESMDEVAALYRLRLQAADNDGDRLQLLQDLARLNEQERNEPRQAFEVLVEAVNIDASDPALLDELARMAAVCDLWRAAAEAVAGAGKRLEEVDQKRDLSLLAADWFEQHVRDASAAEACVRRAVEADPEYLEARDRLVDLLRQGERPAELVAALRAAADVQVDIERGAALAREAAGLAEHSLSDLELAAECLEQSLRLDPADGSALDELVRLAEARELWTDAVQLLQRRAESEMDPSRRAEIRERLAEMLRERLQDQDGAIAALREVLDDDPQRVGTMERLEALLEPAEKWDELRDLLERRLDGASSEQEQASIRIRLAKLCEDAFGQRADAVDYLRDVLAGDPQHSEALAELERLLIAGEDWSSLAELLREQASGMADPTAPQAVALQERLAKLYEERLKDAAEAVVIYEDLLERDPRRIDLLRTLVRLYGQENDQERVADTLERILSVVPPQDVVAVVQRAYALCVGDLSDDVRAETLVRRGLEVAPDSTELAEMLAEHFEQRGMHQELAELLQERGTQGTDVAVRVMLLKRAARIHLERLEDPDASASALEQALALDPSDMALLERLSGLYLQAAREVDAVPLLEKLIASAGDRRDKDFAAQHHRLGRALDALGEPDRALAGYAAAFSMDPTNVGILRDLGRLALAEGDLDQAQKAFRALLLQELDDDLGLTKADVYYALADVAEKQGDREKAVSMLERAIAEDAGHDRASVMLARLKG